MGWTADVKPIPKRDCCPSVGGGWFTPLDGFDTTIVEPALDNSEVFNQLNLERPPGSTAFRQVAIPDSYFKGIQRYPEKTRYYNTTFSS